MSAKIDKSKLSQWTKITDEIFLDPCGLLGKGCFGEVFRGYSLKLDSLIAIKTMPNQGYEREVETLKALSSLVHPNIMGYYGYTEIEKDIYIFIEFCPNGMLTDLIKQGIPEEEALRLFRQLIEGMCYMNAKGKMHRDLKPDNILIGLDKDIKISDFGLAKQTKSIYVTGQMGTPLYAGPEVYTNKLDENYSQRCDVWGAGMILYQMLTQEILFKGVKTFDDLKKEWHKYEIGEKRVTYSQNLHPNWEYFTNFMLTYDPKKRPTFHEVLQRLKKVYDKMLLQIRNKHVHSLNPNTKIGRLQLLLMYFNQKYEILIKTAEKFSAIMISIRVEIKYMVEFLCLSHYLCHMKKLIRNLKYKRVKVDEDDKEDMVEEDNQEFDLLLDKYKNVLEHKYNFYSDQLNNKILPKLIDEYSKKEESQHIVKDLKDMWELANDVREGTYDVEETYNDALKNMIKNKLEKFHKGYISSFSEDELKVYIRLQHAALIEKIFPNNLFPKQNFIKQTLAAIDSKNKQELIKFANFLQKQF